MSSISLNKIYRGDTLEVLKSWPSDFVDCVITSPPYLRTMDIFDFLIEGFSQVQNFFRHCPFLFWASPLSGFFGVFTLAKFEAKLGLPFFDYQIRRQGIEDFRCRKVGCLVAIKRLFGVFGVICFSVIISAKSFFEKLDCWFVNHSYLYSFVVGRAFDIGAVSFAPSGFLNTDITLTINKPCQISEKFLFSFSHNSLIPQMCGVVKGR